MKLLEPTFFHINCDYSFGDQSGYQNGLVSIKDANLSNFEFLNKVDECIKQGKKHMTLFIDNIRLYKRDGIKYTAGELNNEQLRIYKDKVVADFFLKNDLLFLCGQIKNMNFIIYTGFEDTPIDDEIFDKIPENVLKIYASNAISFGGKVVPIPYGIKRKLNQFDNNHEILKQTINVEITPTKLAYLNFSITNPNRKKIIDSFRNESWVTIEINKLNYSNYLINLKKHKFVFCPDGNAIGCDCHRDWETIYMKRVPIVLDTSYLREIYKDIPVLFVKDFSEVTEKLLLDNSHLFDEMSNFDLNNLKYEFIFSN